MDTVERGTVNDSWWRRLWRHSSKATKIVAAFATGLCAIYGAVAIILHVADRPDTCDRTFNRTPNYGGRAYAIEVHSSGLNCREARAAVEQFESDPDTFVYPARTKRFVPYYGISRRFLLAPGGADLACTFTPHGLGGTEHTVRCAGYDKVVLNWSTFQT
ncbi:MAG: hypothetical protein QM648_03640 [Solirubrobacterales bacterium]